MYFFFFFFLSFFFSSNTSHRFQWSWNAKVNSLTTAGGHRWPARRLKSIEIVALYPILYDDLFSLSVNWVKKVFLLITHRIICRTILFCEMQLCKVYLCWVIKKKNSRITPRFYISSIDLWMHVTCVLCHAYRRQSGGT